MKGPALDCLDPERITGKQYQLVSRDDHKLCPKSVQRCEQCRTAFNLTDKVIVKSVGIRERTEKTGKVVKYSGNVPLPQTMSQGVRSKLFFFCHYCACPYPSISSWRRAGSTRSQRAHYREVGQKSETASGQFAGSCLFSISFKIFAQKCQNCC